MTTKAQFIDSMATKNGISKKEAENVTNMFLDTLKGNLTGQSDGVCFRDFFTIKVVTRKGRSGNLNGHEFRTKDTKALKIVTGKLLSEVINL